MANGILPPGFIGGLKTATPTAMPMVDVRVQPADVMGALAGGLQLGEQVATRGDRDELRRQQIEAGKTAQETAEQQLKRQKELAPLEKEQLEMQIAEGREKQRIDSLVTAAAEIQGLPPEQQMKVLEKRRADLQKRVEAGETVDTTDTDEAIAMLQQDPAAFQQTLDQAVDLGVRTGRLGGKGEPGQKVGTFRFVKQADGSILKANTATGETELIEASVAAAEIEAEQKKLKKEAEFEEKKVLKQLAQDSPKANADLVEKRSKIQKQNEFANESLRLIEEIDAIDEDTLDAVTGVKGASSLFGLLDKPIAGTDAAEASVKIERFVSRMQLEGGDMIAGALSDSEQAALKTAMQNLNTDLSDAQFKKELKTAVRLAKKAARLGKKKLADFDKATNNKFNPIYNATPETITELTDEQLQQMIDGGG